MRMLFLTAAMAALVFSAAPAAADPPDWAPAHGWRHHHHHDDDEGYYRPRHREDDDRYDYGYRPRHHGRRLIGEHERIYRGRDGRYYCRRSDGTMGLVVGAAVGGLIGNRLARGHSAVLGTILGAGAGALLGRAIDRGSLHCE